MYIATDQGQTTPGDKILMSTETSCHFGHLLQVSDKSLWSLIIYKFSHDFIHVYSPGTGADNPLGTKFLCQQESLVTLVICCKFQKSLFEVWFYTSFFMILYMYIAPGQGQTIPGDKIVMSTETSCHFGHLLQVKKSLFEVWFYTIFFMILYMYIAPGQGQTIPRGQNFDVNRKALFLPICCKFQRNLFEVWFYTIFLWFNTYI